MPKYKNAAALDSPSQILDIFEKKFRLAYPPQHVMFDVGLSVIVDRIDIVSNSAVLFGDAAFTRFKFSLMMLSDVAYSAMEAGGRDCLLEILQILQSGDRSYPQAKRLLTACDRFDALLDVAEQAYWHQQLDDPSN